MAIPGLNSRTSYPKMEEYKQEGSYSNPVCVDWKDETQWSIYWFGYTFVKLLSPGCYFMYYQIYYLRILRSARTMHFCILYWS
jgi:hypothetical protein